MKDEMDVTCMWEIKNAYKILAGKHEGKRLPGRHRYIWEDNIKIVLCYF
jgi:hypothetical protein